MKTIDYNELDKNIVDLVKYFNENNLPTRMSCDGHNGRQSYGYMWVDFAKEIGEEEILQFQSQHLNPYGHFSYSGCFFERVTLINTEVERRWRFIVHDKQRKDKMLRQWRIDDLYLNVFLSIRGLPSCRVINPLVDNELTLMSIQKQGREWAIKKMGEDSRLQTIIDRVKAHRVTENSKRVVFVHPNSCIGLSGASAFYDDNAVLIANKEVPPNTAYTTYCAVENDSSMIYSAVVGIEEYES